MMQQCKDGLLSRISPYVKTQEEVMLDIFGMTLGWGAVYGEHVIRNARYAGLERPGLGRFNGVIEATDGRMRPIIMTS
jgi:multidrug efflux pump subunit AcrB